MINFDMLNEGDKKQTYLRLENGHEMPVTLIKGSKRGMTLAITAGLHSGEYPGVCASIAIAKDIDAQKLCGNIIIIHCVNTTGFEKQLNAIVFEDEKNLNRVFPPVENGTYSDEIAVFIDREIIKKSDFLIDLHSGGKNEELTDCLFAPTTGDAQINEKIMKAANKTNIPKIIMAKGTRWLAGYAPSVGTPCLLLERGGFGRYDSQNIEAYITDLKLLLQHFKMYNFDLSGEVCDKKIYENCAYLSSTKTGLWYPQVKSGDSVEKGDLLGYITDFFGNELDKFYAVQDGDVFYYTLDLAISEGYPLYAYGN